ncbi:hydroxyisourate hydrolase [Sphingobium sp.]|uniref:hydroxyisourate hydrolase n=1 Tax=Sphingobium sp. TaxID=1912891 RepID=UPI003BB5C9EF
MIRLSLGAATLLATIMPGSATASDISTHVLDLARGVGGADIPATLERKDAQGAWRKVAAARTDANGRVRSFGDKIDTPPGVYRISFDMTAYAGSSPQPFFPEISVTFRATDAQGHYHVPVVVSPYGYSSYRGN